MKYRLYRKDFEIYKKDIYILPTFRIYLNNMIYKERNFSVEFHFIIFHARLLFVNENN